MAISKEMLKKLMQRPELTSLEDIEVQPESIEGALSQQVEEPESEFELDPEIAQGVEKLTTSSDQALAGLPKDEYQADPGIAAQLRKLKLGESLEEEAPEVVAETIDDPSAPDELRKAALERVKKKYLDY